MIELCDVCGSPRGAGGRCACGGQATSKPLELELDLDRGRPPTPVAASPIGAAPRSMAPPAPVVSVVPIPVRESRGPLPPPVDSGGLVSSGVMKLAVGAAIVALLGVGVWAGVRKLRSSLESAVDEAATRPYVSPSRLVVANVTSDYSSEALADGAIVLRHRPAGSAAGLAGWYGADAVPTKQGCAPA